MTRQEDNKSPARKVTRYRLRNRKTPEKIVDIVPIETEVVEATVKPKPPKKYRKQQPVTVNFSTTVSVKKVKRSKDQQQQPEQTTTSCRRSQRLAAKKILKN